MSKEVLQEVLSFCQVDTITKSSTSNRWINDTIWLGNPRFLWRWQHCLSYVSGYGDLELIRLLVTAGVDVNEGFNTLRKDWTPLHWASHNGHTEVVRYLVGAGADIHRIFNANCRHNGHTPIYYAVLGKHYELVTLLNQHQQAQ